MSDESKLREALVTQRTWLLNLANRGHYIDGMDSALNALGSALGLRETYEPTTPPPDPARDMAERIVGRLDAFVAEKARILADADVERDAGRWMWCRDRWQMAKTIAECVREEFLPAEKGTKT